MAKNMHSIYGQILISLMLFAIGSNSFAQITEGFNDGNFIENPSWRGDTGKFVVENNELRLLDLQATGSAYLSTNSSAINGGEWIMTTKLTFNPSSSNYAKIILTSDRDTLSGPFQGYYVMIGNTTDEVSLYRSDGSTAVEIIDGLDGRLNLSQVSVRIKVTRTPEGLWTLFSDTGLTGSFVEEGSARDSTYFYSHYMGVFCNYTSTRSDKFYFDDFLITGTPFYDTIPPAVRKIYIDSTSISIKFSEMLDPAQAVVSQHYWVEPSIGFPASVILQSPPDSVVLLFPAEFPNGEPLTFFMENITDTAGNIMAKQSDPLVF
ncbi:MAG: hypothetical protein OEY34_10305, partial [Cyclobacteriaceae bacterium]|nr:hypothetical protein [Cyclobacteriaceae bacterium]